MDGPKPSIGRVQIRLSVDDPWIPVCSRNNSALNVDTSWDKREIHVACKHLGYGGGWYKEYGRPKNPEQYIAHIKCAGSKCAYEAVRCD